jgi:hypothetical protein
MSPTTTDRQGLSRIVNLIGTLCQSKFGELDGIPDVFQSDMIVDLFDSPQRVTFRDRIMARTAPATNPERAGS